MRSFSCLFLFVVLWLFASFPCAAQGPIDREAFISTAMVVTDQQAFVQVFTGSPAHDKPVLWVQIPEGVEGIGEETIEREGRNGVVIIARESYLFFHQIQHKLRFFDMVEKEGGVTAWFRTYNNVEASSELPILKGKVWMPVFDGLGPAKVEFLDRIPADRKFNKEDRKARRSKK
jgi:hypothetical protein